MFASQPQRRLARKRLLLFLDGTWNKPENHTNVYRLFLMLRPRGEDGLRQLAYYDPGVGTNWFSRLLGGTLGWGLSENVCEAYRWLMENYNEGDEIHLFGFSRGAFTARSLAGLIARCGLLKPEAGMSFRQLFDRYRRGSEVTPIYQLRYERDHQGRTSFDYEEDILLNHAHYGRNLIKMVAVWDTVGSIGLPLGKLPGISRRTLRFHNTHLSVVVENSFQALALDEQRRPYWGILWTNFVPKQAQATPKGTVNPSHAQSAAPASAEASRADDRMIEQRWFAGAHSNVGGGYRNDSIAQRPLAWIQHKAKESGVAFRSEIATDDDRDLKQVPRDSHREFLAGAWRWISGRYVRWVFSDVVDKGDAYVHTVNERIDESVFRRCQRNAAYRPASLLEWAARRKLDLEKLIANDGEWTGFCAPVTHKGIEPVSATLIPTSQSSD